MTITLDGLEFELSDFVGTDGLGHTTTQAATTGASGESYPAEPLFPERIFRAALNQLGQGLYSTSTSSVAIGTGSKSFTLATSVQITDGAFVLITDQANDANYMYGQVTSVVGLVYTVNVTATGGSGTIAAWNFQVSGARGATGATGASYTDEQAQDAVGSILTDSATIDFTYDDATPQITASVKAASITEAMQVLADNTTNNATTSAHGYLKKLDNDATHYMDGTGNWSTPATAPQDMAHVTGRKYVTALSQGISETNVTVTINRLYFLPFYIPVAATYSGVGLYRAGAGGNIRFGLYADNSGEPSALIEDFGELGTGSSGNQSKTFSRSLTAGWYWFGVVFANADSVQSTDNVTALLGETTDFGGSVMSKSLYMSHTYGALPASASGLTYATTKSPLLSIYK